MKKLLRFTFLILSCVVVGGCPYETDVPIDAPSVIVDPNLLGTWIDNGNVNEIYTVSRQDDYTYQIVATQEDEKETETYTAHASIVNKTTFLNIKKTRPEPMTNSYILYKIELRGDQEVILTEITENIDEKFSSSQELKKFISKNMNNSYFYGKDETHLIRPEK
jgi:Zn-finger nucleic acid-binding protein